MKLLRNSEQAPAPVNQPTSFPRFYLIPETKVISSHHSASNASIYHQQHPITTKPPHKNTLQKFIRIEKDIFQETCADAWAELKALGRTAVKWLVWRVTLPLSVVCALWIPFVSPAELPM